MKDNPYAHTFIMKISKSNNTTTVYHVKNLTLFLAQKNNFKHEKFPNYTLEMPINSMLG